MTKDELFTLIALKLGPPREYVAQVKGGGKAIVSTAKYEIDFMCEFISLAASNGVMVNSEGDLRGLLRQYETWYKNNLPRQHTVGT